MRQMNYRHKSLVKTTDRKSSTENSPPATPVSSNTDNESLLSTSTTAIAQQWEADNPNALDSCCICMEDFEEADNPTLGTNELEKIVVLPCKAHFFHEACISAWVTK